MFLDSRWQRSAGSRGGPATDDKIYTTSPPHTQRCHWLEWFPWAFFLPILVLVSGMLIHVSVCNALRSDLQTLQSFLLQEF